MINAKYSSEVSSQNQEQDELQRAEEIAKFLNFIHDLEDGEVYELRCPKRPDGVSPAAVSGYFNDLDKMAANALAWSGEVQAVYYTLNPVKCKDRCRNTSQAKSRQTTNDEEIARRCQILIDIDPVKKTAESNSSSTDEEHDLALAKSDTIADWLEADQGFPSGIRADSGNGGALLYAVDLPNDEHSTELVQRFLLALAQRFNDETGKVDTGVFNPSRISKLYGTLTMKGENTTDRPHRYAQVLRYPDEYKVVPVELLEKVADEYKGNAIVASNVKTIKLVQPADNTDDNEKSATKEWVKQFLETHKDKFDGYIEKPKRRWFGRFLLGRCPFCNETDKSATVVITNKGTIGFTCQHDRCKGENKKCWRDFRKHCEPDWQPFFGPTMTMRFVSQTFATDVSKGRFRHNKKLGGWFAWDGCRYVPETGQRVYNSMVEYLDVLLAKAWQVDDPEKQKAHVNFVASLNNTTKIVDTVRGCEPFLHVGEDDLDANPFALNLRNGWYDLRSMEFHPHDEPTPFTQVAGCEYDPAAGCPLWEKCVSDYWSDEGVRRHFQQQGGLALSGLVEKQMLYLYGTGDNGKTLIFEAMTALMGTYATALPIDALLHKQFSGIPVEIAKLRGARLVTTSELPDGARLNEGMIKQITGGGTITARFMRANPFDFRPQFKLWFDGNFKPNLSTDDAVWSRFNYLPFTKKFDKSEQDKSLLGKLKTQLSGILNWCLRGWLDYLENGLFVPDSLSQQKEDFKKESNEFLTYLETFFTRDADGRVSKADAYGVFKLWWEANHPRSYFVPDTRRFAREMRRFGLGETMYAGERRWTGIASTPVFAQTMKGEFVPQG